MLEEEPDDEDGRGGDQVRQQHVDEVCLAEDYYPQSHQLIKKMSQPHSEQASQSRKTKMTGA